MEAESWEMPGGAGQRASSRSATPGSPLTAVIGHLVRGGAPRSSTAILGERPRPPREEQGQAPQDFQALAPFSPG